MNNINEWTQTYIGGGIARDPGKNNLQEIVNSLNNGQRPSNVIYSILRGMGISEELAYGAISHYITPVGKQQLVSYSVSGTKNNINKIMTENFNLKKLLEYVKDLKENVVSMAQEDNTNINYSARQVMDLCETYEKNIGNISVLLEELNAVKGDAIKETRLKFRLNENDLMGLSQFRYLSEMVSKLTEFNYLTPVGDFIQEAATILEENRYQVLTANCLFNLQNDKNSAYYEQAVYDLKYLIEKGEDGIKSKLKIVMEKHNWINHVSNMVNDFAIYENVSVSNGEGIVNRVYSPLQINEDKSIIFSLSGNYLQLKDNAITPVADISVIENNFFNTEKSLRGFKIVGENLSLYNGNNSLEINTSSKEIKINDVVVESEIDKLRTKLISSNFFNVNEMYRIDELMYLIEGIDTLSELDFVTSVTSSVKQGITVNVIKLDENTVFINRINSTMQINELFKVEDVKEAQEKVNEFVNFDITREIVEMLEDDVKETIALEESKASIVSDLNYLQDKLSEIEKTQLLIGGNDQLTEAAELLKSEIRDKEVDLQEVYTKLGKPVSEGKKLEDKGYIKATITNKSGQFEKGDEVYVYAEDYTTKGDKEQVKIVKSENDKPIFIVKKDVKIK